MSRMMWLVIQILRRVLRVTKYTTPMGLRIVTSQNVEIAVTIIRNVAISCTRPIHPVFYLIVVKIHLYQSDSIDYALNPILLNIGKSFLCVI